MVPISRKRSVTDMSSALLMPMIVTSSAMETIQIVRARSRRASAARAASSSGRGSLARTSGRKFGGRAASGWSEATMG